ncbi:MAG: hypothetical protein H7289_07885 [Mucilaginibacter sp.]|nr:hypothetical protein [Mucilaginibacter sp.]
MKDFLLTADFDLKIENGDFVIGESNQQHQQCLLLAEKGAYKQFPNVGVGLATFINDENPDDLLREVRLEFTKDGMKVNRLAYENGKIKVDADYGK